MKTEMDRKPCRNRFLTGYLFPALREAGLEKRVELFIWDHNKERMIEHIGEMILCVSLHPAQGA